MGNHNAHILSPRAKQIIPQLQLDARCPLTLVAKRLGIKVHVVRYEVDRLIAEQVVKPYVLINPGALGQYEVDIFCTLAERRKGDLATLIEALEKVAGLFVLNLQGGRHQLGFGLVVNELTSVQTFLEKLSSFYGLRLAERTFGLRLGWTQFYRKYLSNRTPPVTQFAVGTRVNKVVLDELDSKILNTLTLQALAPVRDIAKLTGSPESTVTFRLRQLQQSGVIVGFGLSIDASDIGMQAYRITLTLRDNSEKVRQKVQAFCREHPYILNLTQCLGNWDYSIRLEVPHALDSLRISDELHHALGPALGCAEVIPILKEVMLARPMISLTSI